MAFATAVQLEDVWKRFGAVEAVRGVSLRVPAGCIYGLLGPNGAGKTTLIRMIMSIFFADSGRIGLLDGQQALAVKDQLGYLPEEKGLYKKMKVAEQMTYFARLKGVAADVAHRHSAAGCGRALSRRRSGLGALAGCGSGSCESLCELGRSGAADAGPRHRCGRR